MTDSSVPLTDDVLGELQFPMDVRIPSDVRFIEPVVGVVVRRCVERHFPARACRLNVPVALTEALSNAILRGNREDRAKAVRLRADVDEHALVMEVEDEGAGFDLESCLIVPDDDDAIDREDGRGLFLMSRLMDRVEMVAAGGNVVRLTLHRS